MIPLAKPFFDGDELSEVKQALDSGWVAGQGPKSKALEAALVQRSGAAYAVALNNCTAALHLAMLALDVGLGDEVLVSDFTYPATGHAVRYCGADPVFVDVHEDTYNFDAEDAAGKVTPKTKAVIVVHAFGQAADLDAAGALAREHGLPLVEDAACALGATWNGKSAGSFGAIGCYSFHARKNATTGEGGALVTSDAAIEARARLLSCFGMESAFTRQDEAEFHAPAFTALGYNYKLSDINAAIGLAQLRKLDAMVKARRSLAKLYDDLFSAKSLVQPPAADARAFHIYQTYAPKLPRGTDRDRVVSRLRARGIQANVATYASHLQPVYGRQPPCPVSADVYARTLALPLYWGLSEEDVHFVANALHESLR